MWVTNSCVDVDMWLKSFKVGGGESGVGSEGPPRVKMGESIGGYVHSAPQCKHHVEEPLSTTGGTMKLGCIPVGGSPVDDELSHGFNSPLNTELWGEWTQKLTSTTHGGECFIGRLPVPFGGRGKL
jgi:hypothetical protein